jgi:hypothetical protein
VASPIVHGGVRPIDAADLNLGKRDSAAAEEHLGFEQSPCRRECRISCAARKTGRQAVERSVADHTSPDESIRAVADVAVCANAGASRLRQVLAGCPGTVRRKRAAAEPSILGRAQDAVGTSRLRHGRVGRRRDRDRRTAAEPDDCSRTCQASVRWSRQGLDWFARHARRRERPWLQYRPLDWAENPRPPHAHRSAAARAGACCRLHAGRVGAAKTTEV